MLLKGTKVDGVYDADPVRQSTAKRFETLTYMQVLSQDLGVMDASAISLARENRIPILVFSIYDAGAFAEVVCGKGAFMRALARDIAVALGTVGHVTALRRTGVGPFSESDAISLDYLESLGHIPAASEHLHPVEAALDGIPALDLTDTEVSSLRCGQAISLLARVYRERVRDLENGTIVCAKSAGKAVALARYQDGGLHPVRLLNT